ETDHDYAKLRLGVRDFGQEVLNRSTVGNGRVRIHTPNLALDAGYEGLRIHGSCCQDVALSEAGDGMRNESLGHGGFEEAAVSGVSDHSYDLEVRIMRGF